PVKFIPAFKVLCAGARLLPALLDNMNLTGYAGIRLVFEYRRITHFLEGECPHEPKYVNRLRLDRVSPSIAFPLRG
ncbi:MAG: hypothetical protein PHV82_19115, partial [Victivallaceae bacterium]|nr:hypothetical protein [Victivallaceae bacterium]